jgi:hypothetical protein
MNFRATLGVLLTSIIMVPITSAQPGQQSEQLSMAAARWAALAARSYTYKLNVGGVFGSGDYLVQVRNGVRKSRHIGGIGMGKPRFLERFRSEPSCKQRLIQDLLEEVRSDLERGFMVTDLVLDARYGFLSKAYVDSDQVLDQGWGFEVSEFKVLDKH